MPNRATAVETPQCHTFVTLTFLPITTTTTTTNARPPGQRPRLGQARVCSSTHRRSTTPPITIATHHHRHITTTRCSPTTPPIANPSAMSPSNYAPRDTAHFQQHCHVTTQERPPSDTHTLPRHTAHIDVHSRHVTVAAGAPNAATSTTTHATSPSKGSSRLAGKRGQMAGT